MSWYRPHLKQLQAYSAARHEFSDTSAILLDANENPFDSAFNRYPDPMQRELKEVLAQQKQVRTEQIFIGNGSDEAIDLLIRAACEPGSGKIALCSPTYGMYQVLAQINNVAVVDAPLTSDFQLDLPKLLSKSLDCELIFICSPNNPTGNLIATEDLSTLLEKARGLVVVDEAYIDFASGDSWINFLDQYPQLVVLQTFSKAYGLAGLRVGTAYAQPEIIEVLNSIKPPYNVNSYSQKQVLEALRNPLEKQRQIELVLSERNRLTKALQEFSCVQQVFPSEANFLLCQCNKATELYRYLLKKGIVLRDRSKVISNCLRISIGTPQQNDLLLSQINQYEKDTLY